ncbi:hypothetical protein [Moorena sp. SIO3I6]|uniref:hypothetical protein n=1 Tax=Moorena sp. SIO3I6 TaxID=2607831 RepID=UPI0013F7D7F2|nr:hypothetical protein [Moorena sp. SIO3I6]NEO44567.1 hypothetical protein [Moorena sp. SIO4A3]NEP29846.1 hypothetical protein [Moorena sp. SIO3I6]
MGIRRGTGILPVSCLFSRGQDAHSTNIHSKTDATPGKRHAIVKTGLSDAVPIPDSRFPIPDSLPIVIIR